MTGSSLGRRNAAPVQSTELDLTCTPPGPRGDDTGVTRKKSRAGSGCSPALVRPGLGGLLHDLGHGRLTGFAADVVVASRTEPRSAGLVQPVAMQLLRRRSATSWNSLPCDE